MYQNNGSNYSIPIYGEYAVYDNTGFQNFRYTNDGKFTTALNGQGLFSTGYVGGSGAHNHGNTTGTTLITNGPSTGTSGSTSLTTNSTTPGNTGSASTLQPYITCYIWKRTA